MSPISAVLGDEEATQFRQLLKDQGIEFSEDIDELHFEDKAPFETEVEIIGDNDEIEVPYVWHWDVAWYWWQLVQDLMQSTLGSVRVPTALHLHAGYGVAVPGDIDNLLLGKPTLRQPPAPPAKQGLLGKLLGKKADPDGEYITQQIEWMVAKYAGPYSNLVIASSTRLLGELDATVEALGLDDSEIADRYEACAGEEDPVEVGKCYLLMVRAFVREGVQRKHLVWWIK